MKNLQLCFVALGFLFMIQFILATPVEISIRDEELKNKNCTVTVMNSNVSMPEQGDQEEREDPEPSEEFKAEIRQQLELLKNKVLDDGREKRSSTGGISHGNKIALQTTVRYFWLGCIHHCGTYTCPGLFFEGTDWTRCAGEVFRIYRISGPGHVLVGDYVGLYFPAHNQWLGCPSTNCGKYDCPGSPSWQYGFSSHEKWFRCGGEVFRIYARNKGTGSIINGYDDVMFYYVQNRQWLSLLSNENAQKRSCPGSLRPPSASRYDTCGGEVFNIKKQ